MVCKQNNPFHQKSEESEIRTPPEGARTTPCAKQKNVGLLRRSLAFLGLIHLLVGGLDLIGEGK